MSKLIVKIDRWYFEWSTVADAPVTKGMSLPLLAYHVAERYGSVGLEELPGRLERVETHGTSSLDGMTVADLLSCNRAGPKERHLTEKELLDQYVPGRRPGAFPAGYTDPPVRSEESEGSDRG